MGPCSVCSYDGLGYVARMREIRTASGPVVIAPGLVTSRKRWPLVGVLAVWGSWRGCSGVKFMTSRACCGDFAAIGASFPQPCPDVRTHSISSQPGDRRSSLLVNHTLFA